MRSRTCMAYLVGNEEGSGALDGETVVSYYPKP